MEIIQKEGRSMGRIALNDSLKYFEVATSHLNLAGSGMRHFWEIYYLCDQGEMTTYLRFQNAAIYQQDLIVFPPTNGVWKRAYIDLTEHISWAAGYSSTVSVSLSIRGLRAPNSQNANFYFGNIKLISMRAPY
jgi:hypothetical protein